MKDRINLYQLNNKFKSTEELPKWLQENNLSIFDQIRVLRKALGMTQAQLAQRIGSHQGDIANLENGERGDVQLSTLTKTASTLNCELLITLVPKQEISKLLEERSMALAQKIVAMSSANSAMELQKPNRAMIKEELHELQEEILKKRRSSLWEKSDE